MVVWPADVHWYAYAVTMKTYILYPESGGSEA